MYRFLAIFKGIVLPVLLVAAMGGCVSTEHKSNLDGSTTLMVSRSGGEATLQWKGQPGYLYTVMYAPRRSSGVVWKPHPRYSRIRGRGETITLADPIPSRTTRHYRLHIEPDY